MKPRVYTATDATRLGDGRWRIHARAFLAQNGKKQIILTQTQYGDTAEEAAASANEYVAAERKKYLGSKIVSPRCHDSLAVYGRKWLNDICKERVKRSTWDGYSELFRMYVEEPTDPAIKRIGHIRLEVLQAHEVETLYRSLNNTPNAYGRESKARARALHAVLRQMFKDALTKKVIKEPLDLMLRGFFGRRKHRRPQAYTEEQLFDFLNAAKDDHYRAFWYLFAFTGLRPGELLALTREDVDLDAAKLTISKRIRVVPKRCRSSEEERWEVDDPKTDSSIREVLLPADLVPILREHFAVLSNGHSGRKSARSKARKRWVGPYGDLIFKTRYGNPLEWVSLRQSYYRICQRANLGTLVMRPGKEPRFKPLLKPYALRHTYGTLQDADGVPTEIISEILGHTDGGALARRNYIATRTHRQKVAVDVAQKRLQKLRTGTI